ncbi:ABC transporter ATP-binding protein [Candidatus Acetothermia bacterium]|nr:ABC transporter ATP-binding protein [Candidatus Acetothermia bacterium]MBI3642779.1 ABC transporter ATP-binding protein [Candidatus Acetothermia bacterium]
MEKSVEAEGLSKKFNGFTVLDEMNLSVEQGQLYALIGPSGSGKTTFLRILCGFIRPDAGNIQVLGWRIPNFRVQSQLGYMPQETALYPDLTIMQNLEFFGELYDLPHDQVRERAEALLQLVQLENFKNQSIAALSGGMKRRVSLVVSMIHKPRLIVLDEPTVGIDPRLRVALWQYFRELTQQNISLLVTTHHMDEATRCHKIGLLSQGKLIAEGAPDELLKESGADSFDEAFTALEDRAKEVPA